MGSVLGRLMQDLTDVVGCELISEFQDVSTPPRVPRTSTFNRDPRSPSADIARTPIEVISERPVDSPPVTPLHTGRRSYLETDLDSLTTKELASKPDDVIPVTHDFIPIGLSSSHILKLKFLGMDPRSPSSDIVRTPIQVVSSGESEEKVTMIPKFFVDDSISLGSLSSQDISGNSDFTRECSDPSALVSECEDDISGEFNGSPPKVSEDCSANLEPEHGLSKTSAKTKNSSCESPVKTFAKLTVFCEEEAVSSISPENKATPDRLSTKNVRNRARTPLTPLCNRNITPNSIIRAKQSQGIEKEKLAKVKVYRSEEKKRIQGSQVNVGKDFSISTPLRSDQKLYGKNDENTPVRDASVQWDLDTSIVI